MWGEFFLKISIRKNSQQGNYTKIVLETYTNVKNMKVVQYYDKLCNKNFFWLRFPLENVVWFPWSLRLPYKFPIKPIINSISSLLNNHAALRHYSNLSDYSDAIAMKKFRFFILYQFSLRSSSTLFLRLSFKLHFFLLIPIFLLTLFILLLHVSKPTFPWTTYCIIHKFTHTSQYCFLRHLQLPLLRLRYSTSFRAICWR